MKKYRYFFLYISVALFLFFGSYQDRILRAQFIGRTIFFPLTYSVNEFRYIRKLLAINREQQLTIGSQVLKIIDQETKLQKFKNSKIEFAISDTTYVFADVIGFSGDFFGRTLVVSKGLRDGVREDNPVFSSYGIVGKVVVAYHNFSIVLPLNHANYRMAVVDKNSGVQGVLMADIYSNIAMEYLKFGSNISVGDTLVTSNLSQIFPSNFPVGRVVRLEESSNSLYFRAVVQPFNDVSNLQNVFILLSMKKDLHEIDIDTDY